MPGTLRVRLNDRVVGTLTNVPGDYTIFAFEPDFVADRNRPVLSQSLIDRIGEPLRVVPRTHRVAPPFFSNLLPEDGSALRSLIARQYGLNRTPDFPFLRALGSDLPGAVILDGDADANLSTGAAENSLVDDAGQPLLRFSLAGLQLKFSARLLDDRFSLTSHSGGSFWILKLPTNAFARLPENEFAMMSLAAQVGLNVPSIALRSLATVTDTPAGLPGLREDEPHICYAIERFDRLPCGGRVHAEDFNQIANQHPADKYESRSTSFVASVVRQLCEPDDVDEIVRRVVFGVCIGNDDMHLKNWGLVYPDGRNARLAPMYDFVCTKAYYPAGRLALTVGNERDNTRVTREVIRRFARLSEISSKRTAVLVDEVVEKLRAAWPVMRERVTDRRLAGIVDEQFARVPLMNGR